VPRNLRAQGHCSADLGRPTLATSSKRSTFPYSATSRRGSLEPCPDIRCRSPREQIRRAITSAATVYDVQMPFQRAGIGRRAADVKTGHPICQRDSASPEQGARPGITSELPNQYRTVNLCASFLSLLFAPRDDRLYMNPSRKTPPGPATAAAARFGRNDVSWSLSG
jgi:hypothetical protein